MENHVGESQTKYWDSESLSPDYFDRQIDGLREIGVQEMIDGALKYLPHPPKKILELGGGSQFVSRYLCQKFPDAEIICTDISKVRVTEANHYYKVLPPNLTTEGGVDACSLPYKDHEFDLIVGDAMLHHIVFLKPALFEINRCLSPNGRAIFVREPIIGTLGILTYIWLQKLNKDAAHIIKNHFEYKRMLSQWHYEFIMAGFKIKTLNHWKNQSLMWRLRSIFPHLTPCYVGFLLEPKARVKELLKSQSSHH